MLVTIDGLLDPERLQAVQALLGACRFVDGKHSAGAIARGVKSNQEAQLDGEQFEALNNVVMTALVKHPSYLHSAFPARIAAPIYARYRAGMGYGTHIDDPLMGGAPRYRSDVSVTVFLNGPADYEGGELCIDTGSGETRIKLAAGSAVLYPSNARHSVSEVTSGERLVAVSWVQSMIRDAGKRRILSDLVQARDAIDRHRDPQTYSRVEDAYVNLMRMWAEP